MWSQIISSSSQMPKMAILPSDDYCLMTIFLPCPEVVIISNTHCTARTTVVLHYFLSFQMHGANFRGARRSIPFAANSLELRRFLRPPMEARCGKFAAP